MIPSRFIIVDNDPVNNLLCDLAIKDAIIDADIIAFTHPLKAFEYIIEHNESNNGMSILLLDINMPIWSGWDFVDHFDKLDQKIKNRFKIYMLSSSIDNNDKLRAVENNNVVDYIEKPLTEEKVFSLL
ncbi:MAG: response regulator [Ferruginibacter sp.]